MVELNQTHEPAANSCKASVRRSDVTARLGEKVPLLINVITLEGIRT